MAIVESELVVNSLTQKDPNKDVPIEETTIDPGKNWQEGKKTSSFSGNDKYSKPTYKVEIRYKSDNNIYLSRSDFADESEATNWLNDQKEKTNTSLSSSIVYSTETGKLEGKPSEETYDDLFKDEIIECKPLNGSTNNNESSKPDELKESITKAFGTAKNPLSFSYNDIINNISKITTEMSTKISLQMDKSFADAQNMLAKKVTEMEAKCFEASKTTIDKEMEKLNINAEKMEEMVNKKINEETEKEGKVSLEAKNKINKLCSSQIMSKALQGAAEIARHMDEGPAYVIKEVYKLLKPLKSQMESISARSSEEINKEQDKLAQSLGAKKGLSKAEEYNKKIQKLVKEQYEKLKTAEAQAKNKAFQGLQVGKLKIMALTGVKV